ncbi:hypothetical protein RJ640_009542 [Escallonia rubra]|uniref:DUF4283 domain-containing protein n=1 Tax=Escallonia rubra TaxID=112253 RepID=A0AA88QEV8_9ASTE|nr:hypothetical protein RJ640_009542 [Escallonia rubra]
MHGSVLVMHEGTVRFGCGREKWAPFFLCYRPAFNFAFLFVLIMDNIITQTRSLLCEDFIELEADNLNATMEAALTLVVKAITTKTIPLKPLQNILLKAWKPLKGMKVQHIQGNIFSVTFNHEWDRKRIMVSRPWSIMSSHLVVRDWSSDRAIEELSFDYSPFWIRIFGLPPNQMMKINAEKIGAKIGKVLDIDFTSDGKISWNKFLRIQVELNITTPLHSGFHRSKAANTKSWISLRTGIISGNHRPASFRPGKGKHVVQGSSLSV